MKRIYLTSLLGILCLCAFCQTNSNSSDFVYSKLIIDETYINTNKITITDSLIIHGKLINDGIIYTKYCLIDGGELFCTKKDSLIVQENLILQKAKVSSLDTTNIVTIQAQTVCINDFTNIESAYITTNDFIINDTLEFSGKLGVKTILGDFIINGSFKNSANENIQLHGNAYNNTNTFCTNCNFELLGTNKHFYGNFSCYRVDLENPTSTYTNHDSLVVTNSFSGKGTLIQDEESYLEIRTNTSPTIIASASGNTLAYTRGGNQALNCSNCYNLIISKDRQAALTLTQPCTIQNELQIKKKSFLDCDQFPLTILHPSNSFLNEENCQSTHGIFLRYGTIHLTLPTNEPIWIPLFTNDTTFAGIHIENFDEEHTYITIDSLFSYSTYCGSSIDKHIENEFIKITWHISSLSSKTKLGFFWKESSELPYFNHENFAVYQSVGNGWKQATNETIIPTNSNETITKANGYFTIASKQIILSNKIEIFDIQKDKNNINIYFQTTESQPCILEKSIDGTNFFPIKTFSIKNSLQSFCDTIKENNATFYYRIGIQYDKNNILYSNIRSISVSYTPSIIVNRLNKNINTNITTNYKITLYNQYGIKIKEIYNHDLSLENIVHGLYIILLQTPLENITQKFIW